MYVIQCNTETQFFEACYQMMTKGACYTANIEKLTITLTGGF